MKKKPDDEKAWMEFREQFSAFVVEDIKKSLHAGVQVGTIILTSVGIECLSGYYVGKEAKRNSFKAFIREFMPEYTDYAEDIYTCIRNGLAHDYVINRIEQEDGTYRDRFLLTGNQGEAHLIPSPRDPYVMYFNRENFALDFLKAQESYFAKVEGDQSTWDKAIQRLRRTKKRKGFLTVRPEEQLIP